MLSKLNNHVKSIVGLQKWTDFYTTPLGKDDENISPNVFEDCSARTEGELKKVINIIDSGKNVDNPRELIKVAISESIMKVRVSNTCEKGTSGRQVRSSEEG